jgi:hypothetical protein
MGASFDTELSPQLNRAPSLARTAKLLVAPAAGLSPAPGGTPAWLTALDYTEFAGRRTTSARGYGGRLTTVGSLQGQVRKLWVVSELQNEHAVAHCITRVNYPFWI